MRLEKASSRHPIHSKRAGNPQGGRGAAAPTPARYPATRMGVEDTIREAFNEAKAYKADWDAYDAQVAKGEHPIPPRKDLKLEPLKEVLEGKRYVHSHCYRSDEILMLIRVADEFGFKIRTFQHVLEGYKVAKEIAAHGAGAGRGGSARAVGPRRAARHNRSSYPRGFLG